jgi:hypothetical protein
MQKNFASNPQTSTPGNVEQVGGNITIVAKVRIFVHTEFDDDDRPYPVSSTKIITVVTNNPFSDLKYFEELAADYGDCISSANVLAVYDGEKNSLPKDSEYYRRDRINLWFESLGVIVH